MKINLTKSVPLKELCKISAIGHTEKEAKWMEFTFSHEARQHTNIVRCDDLETANDYDLRF